MVMTKLIYSVLLCHFIAAFAALGMPLFLPIVLPTLSTSIDADWAGVLFILPTFCTALAARFWGNFADRYGRRRSLLRAQLGLAAGFALCGLANNFTMFVFGLIVQGTFGGTMAASNSYLSSHIKEAKTLSKSLNKTQLSARLALIVAPIGLGWSLSETSPLNAYLWLCILPLLSMGITLTLPADNPAEHNLEKPNAERQQEQPAVQKSTMHAIRWIFFAQFGFAFSMVVTFPYFSPFVQQYGITNHAWIGFLYALPHGVYLLLAGKIHVLSNGLNHHQPMSTLWLGFALLAVSSALHLFVSEAALIAARVFFGVAMVCCYHGLHQHLASNLDRKLSGKIFSRFDAMSKWGGVTAGFCASFISSLGLFEAPFLLSAIVSVITLTALVIHSKFGNQHVTKSILSD
ncbi:MFS transporter [Aeromonas veronii]|nr:MFS transporter [Aeromonas veronii]MCX0445573.1 MFS transporter [Aeromonas veronii]UZE61425.1 MFS transporter [Aeromonas veronii]